MRRFEPVNASGTGAGAPRTQGAERTLPLDDPAALGALLDALRPRMTAVALRLTRDADGAGDVVQNACEKVLRHAARFRGDARVSTWVHRIVTTEALMWLRARRRQGVLCVNLDGAVQRAPDPTPGPWESLARQELQRRLARGLGALRPEEREVLLHCALEGRSYADLARETGAHPAALKTRAFRARRRLSQALGDG